MNKLLLILFTFLYLGCSCKTVIEDPPKLKEKVLIFEFNAPVEEEHRIVSFNNKIRISNYFSEKILSNDRRIISPDNAENINIMEMKPEERMSLLDYYNSDYLYGGDLFFWGDSQIILFLLEVQRFPYKERVISIPIYFDEESSEFILENPIINNAEDKKGDFFIVLDPGHGGLDSGVETKWGKNEAYLNLLFTEMLEKELISRGYRVELTHRGDIGKEDIYYPKDRALKVNRLNPDLFISIHHDYSPRQTDRGFSIFYTSFKPGLDNEDIYITIDKKNYRYISQRRWGQGSEIIYEDNGKRKSTRNLPWYVYHEDYIKDNTPTKSALFSFQFALTLYYELQKIDTINKSTILQGYPLRDRDYAVLRFCNTPSILIEMGHLSNEQDFNMLTDDEQKRFWIEAFTVSIDKYFDMTEKD